MSDKYVLQSYYEKYLVEVRKLSASSVGHYVDAINWISRYLKSKGLIQDMLYEVLDYAVLDGLNTVLLADPDFVAMNKRGHQMYTAGMNNYLKFAKGKDFDKVGAELRILDSPMPVPDVAIAGNSKKWKRSAIIRDQSLVSAHYLCEISPTHRTFIVDGTKHQYMEGHHAIPMNKQDSFKSSLDIYANIVCVCPICHRLLHYGQKCEKKMLLNQIYEDRGERLANSGIRLSKTEFTNLII